MKTSVLKQNDFDALLDWLAPDREEAGRKYEEIREGISKFFYFKGVENPEDLADETISRVAARVTTFNDSENVKTITYFLAFAANILHEYNRKLRREAASIENRQVEQVFEMLDAEGDERLEFLAECLKRFSPEERELILDYYSEEKARKIEIRKQLAEQFSCDLSVLHVRVHRLKNKLGSCIRKKIKKKL